MAATRWAEEVGHSWWTDGRIKADEPRMVEDGTELETRKKN
jgi:hypothetical protein